MRKLQTALSIAVLSTSLLKAQPQSTLPTTYWHGLERVLRYSPQEKAINLLTGNKKYNKALYSSGSSFRLEAGDLPAFAVYMNGMAGNLKLGIIAGTSSKWLYELQDVKTSFSPGTILYELKDPILGTGSIFLTVTTTAETQSAILKISASGTPGNIELFAAYGGASGLLLENNGDLGAAQESAFELIPGNCSSNIFTIKKSSFKLTFGGGGNIRQIEGVFPADMKLKLVSAEKMTTPLSMFSTLPSTISTICGKLNLKVGKTQYFLLRNPLKSPATSYSKLHILFDKTQQEKQLLNNRLQINTPDAYVNTVGGAIAVATDALWTGSYFAQSAVASRNVPNAANVAPLAGILGWKDRTKEHFLSLVKTIEQNELAATHDTVAHSTKVKTLHADLGLRTYDALLQYLEWNGDLDLAKQIWPLLTKHLAWEKASFDSDGDGLYDAYNALDNSMSLYYSGGGVAYATALNYRANRLAANIGRRIGMNGSIYKLEADKIYKALHTKLWLPKKGIPAEYIEANGKKATHASPSLWSIYYGIDSKVLNWGQAYEATRFIDKEFPHIPVRAKGWSEQDLYALPSTTWQPYVQGQNNVSMRDQLYAALAYWKTGRSTEAYTLFRSALISSMFMGTSPGNFEEYSFYDAHTGSTGRDNGESIALAGKAIIEGLYGIQPNGMADTLTINPGFPKMWNQASVHLPELSYNFNRNGLTETYKITLNDKKGQALRLLVPANSVAVKSVTVNGQKANWKSSQTPAGYPILELIAPRDKSFDVEINWEGLLPDVPLVKQAYKGAPFAVYFSLATIEDYADPQRVLSGIRVVDKQSLNVDRIVGDGEASIFLKLRQRDFTWWQAIPLDIKPDMEINYTDQSAPGLHFRVTSNEGILKRGLIRINPGPGEYVMPLEINKGESRDITVPAQFTRSGTNKVRIEYRKDEVVEASIVNWFGLNDRYAFEKVSLKPYYNDKVGSIFKNQYLHPRSNTITMQLPIQGVGNALTPYVSPNIDDSGIRRMAFANGHIMLPNRVPLETPGVASVNNIIYTSLFNNYPDSVSVPLRGHSGHAYLLMAGSTSAMQSGQINALIRVIYTDNSSTVLELKNPENWWPIEQDYYIDGAAFSTGQPMPFRVYLKSGMVGRNVTNYTLINNFSKRIIDGGAATVVDLPLDANKELRELRVVPVAQDVVVGLMSLTLQR